MPVTGAELRRRVAFNSSARSPGDDNDRLRFPIGYQKLEALLGAEIGCRLHAVSVLSDGRLIT